MAFISHIDVSLPEKRLTDEIYFKATKVHLNGERTVADFDEDSITLSYSAGEAILEKIDRNKVGELYFVSTTPVYAEKSNAGIIATALDLKKETRTYDLTGSTRSLLSAIKLASENLKNGFSLVVSGEVRIGIPGSQEELYSGDCGGAILLSDKDGVAEIIAHSSFFSNFMFSWRLSGEHAVTSGEQKFIMEEGFRKTALAGIKEFLRMNNIKPSDINYLLLLAPDGRAQAGVYRETGIKGGKEEIEQLYTQTGFCGTVTPLLLFAAIIDKLKKGDMVLLCAYGDGIEILLLRATVNGSEINFLNRLTIKKPLNDYSEFLKLKGFIEREKIKPFTSIPVLTREEEALLRLHGTKCRKCGTIQYPPRRICWNCSAKDEMEDFKLNKHGTIYTYTKDYVYTSPFPPTAMAVLDLDGGGRFYCQVVDPDKNEINIGSRMKLTLRRLHEGGDFVHYFWKAMRE